MAKNSVAKVKTAKRRPHPALLELVLILVIVAVVAGLLIHHSTQKKHNASPIKHQPAASFQGDVVQLGVDNLTALNKALDASMDGSSNAASQKQAVYNNADKITAQVKNVYGNDVGSKFQVAWKVYLDQSFNYATASKKGDEAAKTKALQTMSKGFSAPLASTLAKINPNIQEVTLRSGLDNYVLTTSQMIDAHAKGDSTQEASILQDNTTYLRGVLSYVAAGIVNQSQGKNVNQPQKEQSLQSQYQKTKH